MDSLTRKEVESKLERVLLLLLPCLSLSSMEELLSTFHRITLMLGIYSHIIGMCDISIIRDMTISSSSLHLLKTMYLNMIEQNKKTLLRKQSCITYTFDFDTLDILPKIQRSNDYKLIKIDKLAFHINNVVVWCYNSLVKDPSIDNYYRVIQIFNNSANFINQFFKVLIIPLISNPRGKKRVHNRPVKNPVENNIIIPKIRNNLSKILLFITGRLIPSEHFPSILELLNKFKELSETYGIIDQVIGLVDINIISGIAIDLSILEILKEKYQTLLSNPIYKWSYSFNFILCKILHNMKIIDTFSILSQLLTSIDKLAFHIYNVVYFCKHRLDNDPTLENYHKMISKFNISANFINQYFSEEIIFLVHNPRAIKRKPSQKFKIGILIDGLYNSEIELKELNGWKLEFAILEKDYGIEWIKNNETEHYNQMLDFHRKGRTLAHGKDSYPHYWVRDKMWHYAKVINNFLNSKKFGGIITRKNKLNYIRKYKQFTPFGNIINSDTTIKEDYIGVPCPCLNEEYFECECLFNLSDPQTFDSFSKAFEGYTQITDINDFGDQIPDPVKIMFTTLEVLRNPELRPNIRMKSTCPKCNFVNEASNEALWNSKGNTPKLIHPSDMKCRECAHEYCTDCKQYHPGFICRGFVEEPDCDPNIQLCPACAHTTYRVDGCTCITCEIPNCRKTWCWICRCLRYPEQHGNDNHIHYCMDEARYSSNPSWLLNADFKPYKQRAPSGRIGIGDYVPE